MPARWFRLHNAQAGRKAEFLMTDVAAATVARDRHSPADRRPEWVEFGPVRHLDAYRWLEDDADPEEVAWRRAQDNPGGR
jgi:hypothetical protein